MYMTRIIHVRTRGYKVVVEAGHYTGVGVVN